MSDHVQQIKDRLSITHLVGQYVPLKQRGAVFIGLCPFHAEKTPSFTVSPSKGIYHCFGCQAGGDIFSFIQGLKGMSFQDSLVFLASMAGVALPVYKPLTPEAAKQRKTLYDVQRTSALWFQHQLSISADALAYMKHRNLSPESQSRFIIGYAPDSDALYPYLLQAGFDASILRDSGLFYFPDSAPMHVAGRSRFRDRLMFPILDSQQRTIAFGGRLLAAGEPKYLNSPETPIFSKGKTLYGLAQHLTSPRQTHPLCVVEGYMDVIALHQHGFTSAVATLGTAATLDHLRLLLRYGSSPIFCFDSDGAGERAALKLATLFLPLLTPEHSPLLAHVVGAKDPDELLSVAGIPAFEAVLSAARPLSTFLFDTLLSRTSLESPEKRASFEAVWSTYVESITHPRMRYHFLQYFRQRQYQHLAPFFKTSGSRGRSSSLLSLQSTAHHAPMRLKATDFPTGETLFAAHLFTFLVQFPHLVPDVASSLQKIRFKDTRLDTHLSTLLNTLEAYPDSNAAFLMELAHGDGFHPLLHLVSDDWITIDTDALALNKWLLTYRHYLLLRKQEDLLILKNKLVADDSFFPQFSLLHQEIRQLKHDIDMMKQES